MSLICDDRCGGCSPISTGYCSIPQLFQSLDRIKNLSSFSLKSKVSSPPPLSQVIDLGFSNLP